MSVRAFTRHLPINRRLAFPIHPLPLHWKQNWRRLRVLFSSSQFPYKNLVIAIEQKLRGTCCCHCSEKAFVNWTHIDPQDILEADLDVAVE